MNAIQLFGEIVAQRQKTAAWAYARHQDFTLLENAGWIEEVGVVQSTYCDDCDHPHDAAVVYEDGQYGYYCPDLGFVAKDRLDIVAIQPNIATFIEQLANELNCKRRKSTAIAGPTWRIGSVETHAGNITIYFHPVLQDADDLNDLSNALAKEVKSRFGIVLTAKGSLLIAPFKTVCVQNCLSIAQGDAGFRFDLDIEAIVGIPPINTGGRPNFYKPNIKKIMDARESEGRAQTGRNAEAKGVLAEYRKRFPTEPVPSQSVVKRYVTEIRSGS